MNTTVNGLIRFLRSLHLALLAIVIVAGVARSADAPTRSFEIPAGEALVTLKQFAAQSGAQLLYSAGEVEGVRTSATQGQFLPREALERMLGGTKLAAELDERTGALTIRLRSPAAKEPIGPRRDRNAASPTRTQAAKDGEIVSLSPFEVTSDKDVGYAATASLSGTRIRTELRDLGSSISVVTREFIDDSAVTGIADLLVYTTGTEVGGAYGNFTNSNLSNGRPLQQQNREDPESNTRVRGLVRAEISRDFFITDFGFDTFNVERVELSRGPNSILFGVGSPGGVVNYSLKKARLNENKNVFSVRIGERGTHRETLDMNTVIAPNRVALRLNVLAERENFRQEPAFERDRRVFGALEAVVFQNKRSPWLSPTKLSANFELATLVTTPPSVVAPIDDIRDWYQVPDVAAIVAQTGQPAPAIYSNGTFQPQAMHDRFGANTAYRGSLSQNLPWFIAIGQIFSNPTGGNAPLIGFRKAGITDLQGGEGRVLNSFDWLQQNNLVEEPWTSGFAARSFQNRAIYDFETQLITGTLEQRQDQFKSGTVTLEQLFLGGQGGLELSYNQQHLRRRKEFPFSDFRAYDVRVDNNLWLGNREPNPNAGRPFIVSRAWGNHDETKIDRGTARATAFYNLDIARMAAGGRMKWFGRHVFSGIAERAKREESSRSYALAVSSREIDMEVALAGRKGNTRRQLHAGFYVGPDMRGIGNYSDVRLSGYVDVPGAKNGDTFRTFVRNPVNGQILNVTAFADEFLDGGSARNRIIDTSAVTWQGYLLDNYLVGLVGLRRDRVRDTLSVGAPRFADGTFDPTALRLGAKPNLDASGNTRTSSLVAHFPEKYLFRLPWGADLSVFASKSENFQPTSFRQDVFLRSIAPPNGATTERGFALSLFNNRLNLRTNWFETRNNNISLESSLAAAATNPISGWINRLAEARRINVPFGFDINGRSTGLANYYSSYDQVINVLLNMVPEPLKSARNLRIEGAGVGLQTVIGDPVPGLTSTSSFVAKGLEFELVANPTPRWTLAMNVAKQETVQSGSGVELQEYYGKIRQAVIDAKLWDTNIPDEPNVQGNITYRDRLSRDYLNPLAAITAKDGAVSQEQRKWRMNLMTSYRFEKETILRGFEVGGAVRWQDKAAVGYPIILVPSAGSVLQIPNLNFPFFAPETWNGDVFLRYRKKIFREIRWSVQLNLRNVVGSDDLLPERINPDGKWAAVRIPVQKAYYLTNTFEF